MKAPRPVYLVILLLGLGGGALFVTLLIRQGIGDVLASVARAGWGLVAVIALQMLPLLFDALTWRALIPRKHRLSLWTFLWIHWVGDSVSSMLPVAQVGGELVRVRLVAARGIPTGVAAASVMVGLTVGIATQIVFTLTGLGLLVIVARGSGLLATTLLGTVIGVAVLGAFFAVQRVGMFRMAGKIISHLMRSNEWKGLVKKGEAFDDEVRGMYARGRAITISALWNMCTWASGALEVWVALWAVGATASYTHAYILESMAQGIRSVLFLVPGALGVQEGGYVLVGMALGIDQQTALALAMIRRVRELVFGIPGLLVWQWVEGRLLWQRGVTDVSSDSEEPAEAATAGSEQAP